MSENYVFTLDAETRVYCEKILNETDKSRVVSLTELKKWSEENPKLHIDTCDRNLLSFLRGSKFNLDKTKLKLKNFYELRRDTPEWFNNRNPHLSEIEELVKLGVFVPLRQQSSNSSTNQMIVIIRTAAHDPKKHKQDDVFKTGKMILDVACMLNERAHIYGVTAIFDMAGVGLGHARQLTPAIIKRAVNVWQNYHCRPQNLEFINAPTYINIVLSVFKSFMSNKLKQRIRVHYKNDVKEALKGIGVDEEMLPKEYEGNGDSVEELANYWHQQLVDHSEWFRENEQYKAEKI